MRSICLYFQVHQPFRLRTYRFFDIGADHSYYDDVQNRTILRRVAERCYLPANNLMLELIRKHGGAFKVSYSITGLALEQFTLYAPEVIESFRKLARTGCVEFLTETYAHSLASLRSKEEFTRQVKMHHDAIRRIFDCQPKTFRNTELIYSDGIGEMVDEMGYETVLTEGARHILGWRSPNFLYRHPYLPGLKLLLKNFRLSDDIAFRFSNQAWSEWPLTAEKYAGWLNHADPKQQVINLFLDYETFGEHQWKETGIFDFLRAFPSRTLRDGHFTFNTPSELSATLKPVAGLRVRDAISWADEERDLTAWLGNDLQYEAFDTLYNIENLVRGCTDPDILKDWNYLQASDHFYYMSTKWFSDGDVHRYFNPYQNPYDAFINYMNVLSDFIIRVEESTEAPGKKEAVQKPAPAREKPARASGKPAIGKKTSTKAFRPDDLLDLPLTAFRKLAKKAGIENLFIATSGQDGVYIAELLAKLTRRDRDVFRALSESKKKPARSAVLRAGKNISKLIP